MRSAIITALTRNKAAIQGTLTAILNKLAKENEGCHLTEEELQSVIRLASKAILFYYGVDVADIARIVGPDATYNHASEVIRATFSVQRERMLMAQEKAGRELDKLANKETSIDELEKSAEVKMPEYPTEGKALIKAAKDLQEKTVEVIERLANPVIARKAVMTGENSLLAPWLDNTETIQSALTSILNEIDEVHDTPELNEEERQAAIKIANEDILRHFGIEETDLERFTEQSTDELDEEYPIISDEVFERATLLTHRAIKTINLLVEPIADRRLLKAIFSPDA